MKKRNLFVAGTLGTLLAAQLILAPAVSAAVPEKKAQTATTQITTTVSNPKELASKLGGEIDPNKVVGAVRVSSSAALPTQNNTDAIISPESGSYLTNIRHNTTVGSTYLKKAVVMGPSDYTMSISDKRTVTITSNTEISAEFAKQQLGVSVANEVQIIDSYKVTVPAGATYNVYAYAEYDLYQFDVWYDPFFGSDYYQGYGSLMVPTGACYFLWTQV